MYTSLKRVSSENVQNRLLTISCVCDTFSFLVIKKDERESLSVLKKQSLSLLSVSVVCPVSVASPDPQCNLNDLIGFVSSFFLLGFMLSRIMASSD